MTENKPDPARIACPIPISDYPRVLLAHGGGGRLMHTLIEKMFVATFDNPTLSAGHDGAVLSVSGSRMAFTTDSYVVHPLFFPGGDIGSMAVHGTVNDLAMCGARPQWLSAGFILEEGFEMDQLWRIVQSMQGAARECEVRVVTGDTKVVERGSGDGVFINTAGVGVLQHDRAIAPSEVKPGDAILLSGDVGRHGIAIMAAREGLEFECTIESDCAPLNAVVGHLLEKNIAVHCMRDLTRGGLASALIEIAEKSGRQIDIDERAIPVAAEVQGGCELLGLDPLYVANEGRFVAFVDRKDVTRAAEIMRSHTVAEHSCIIGHVSDQSRPVVTIKSKIGTRRILDMFSGEQLPRIC